MAISINYRFLLRVGGWLVVATALLSLMLLQVLGHHEELVPLWGQISIATDLLTFSFFLGFFISLVVTKLTHQALLNRKVLPLHWHLKSQTLIDRLPTHTLHRAFMLGLAGVLVACLTLLLFRLRHINLVPYKEYLIIFTLHAVSLAGTITVMAVYRALGDYARLRQVKSKIKNTSGL